MEELANKLIKIELELNCENELPLGSLLAEYWIGIFEETNNNHTLKIFSMIKHSLLYILRKNKKLYDSKKILVGKCANTNHINKLVGFIVQFDDQVSLFQGNYRDLNNGTNFLERLSIVIYSSIVCLTKERYLRKKLREYGLNKHPVDMNVLFFNIVYYVTCVNFLKKTNFKKVVVDYDRQNVPLVLAAKSLKVLTITLQHGVINPPYGFAPIIADEIWVWGEFWKNILITMGVKESSIKIVGSSIVDDYNEPKKNRTITRVGIGPNPIGVRQNEELWKSITSYLCESGFHVIVKLHPSMKKVLYASSFDNRCQIYEAGELENIDFFEMVDLLIVSSSGLGYECVVSGTPVAVIRQHLNSAGNDALMIDKCGFMEIKNSYISLSEVIKKIETKYFTYVFEQQQFVKNHVYANTGIKAEHEVLKGLDLSVLYDVNP